MRAALCIPLFGALWLSSAEVWGQVRSGTDAADRGRVLVGRFSGPLGPDCRRVILQLLARKGMEVEHASETLVDEGDELLDLPRIARRLEAEAERWPRVGLALLGTSNEDALRLGIFGMPDGALVGLKTFSPGKRCRLSARTEAILGTWLEALAVGGEGAGPEPTPSEDPKPRPSDWITPGRVNVSGEDPMFPDRTSSREPPRPRTRRSVSRRAPEGPGVEDALSLVELEVGLHAVNRSLSFVHLSGSSLRGHEVSLAPALGLSARAFPVPSSVPVLSGLGLHFSYWRSVQLDSVRIDGGPRIPTTLSSMELGLRYRVDLRSLVRGLELLPIASFHRSSFALSALGAASEPAVPNLDYVGAKLGLEARAGLQGPVSIEAELAFMPVFDAGAELVSERFFSAASGYGVQAKARFVMRLSPLVQLLVGAELQSFSFDLEPGAGLAVLAGDRALLVSLGLRFTESRKAD